MSERFRFRAFKLVVLMVLLVVASCLTMAQPSEARKKSSGKSAHAGKSSRHGGGARASRGGSRHSASSSRHSRGGKHSASSRRGRHGHAVAEHGKHHGRHHHHHHVAHKPRYAYPVDMFMMKAPEFDATPLPEDQASEVASAFYRGTADRFPARTLVKSGIVKYHALRGGIYWRREPVKYLIMHSTETGIPVSAVRVIEAWSSLGRRHPGAQYVVDRDGTIYQTVDPDLATVHINILKTLPGINNDNSIGIEINHTGSQDYPEIQMQSVIRLVTYLQDRYQIQSENIVTHRYAQQGDHTDPVHFNWNGFLSAKDRHRNEAIAYKMNSMEKQSNKWGDFSEATTAAPAAPSTYLQPHTSLPATAPGATVTAPVVVPGATAPGAVVVDPLIAPTTNGTLNVRTPNAVASPDATIVKPTPGPVPPTDAAGTPPLRGPIEVGPEHADDLKNVMPN